MINFGSYDLDNIIDIEHHNRQSNILLNSPDVKYSGSKNFNKFIKVPLETKKLLSNYFNSLLQPNYFDWNFEYFHSGEPAGLHTDYETITLKDNKKCLIVVGVIIPLEWNCKQPYTICYDKVSEAPRKLMYRKGEMRYKDNDEIFHYRDEDKNKWSFDKESIIYNPKNTKYFNEYADLKVHSVYQWTINTALVFDTKRWHSSCWFLSSNDLPEVSTEYKKSIIGFGSINYDSK